MEASKDMGVIIKPPVEWRLLGCLAVFSLKHLKYKLNPYFICCLWEKGQRYRVANGRCKGKAAVVNKKNAPLVSNWKSSLTWKLQYFAAVTENQTKKKHITYKNLQTLQNLKYLINPQGGDMMWLEVWNFHYTSLCLCETMMELLICMYLRRVCHEYLWFITNPEALTQQCLQ